jgi:hypothetical protein
MTKDEILALAREVGLLKEWMVLRDEDFEGLKRFAALVATAERDRICTMLDGLQKQTENHNYYGFIRNLIREMK